MKFNALFLFFIIIYQYSYSQDYSSYLDDAYRLSAIDYQGTARAQGMASAFGALGGDLSSISINPAGLGVYRSSEFTLTPGFNSTTVNTNYLGSSKKTTAYAGSLNNIGFVINSDINSDLNLVSASLAFNVSRVGDYNNSQVIDAKEKPVGSSFAQFLTNNSNNPEIYYDPFWEGLAYDANVVRYDSLGYYNNFENDVNQKKYKISSGGNTEYQIAYGLNFDHKVYVGASVSLVSTKYIQQFDITEIDIDDYDLLNSYRFHHELSSIARGINAKFGFIYRPNESYRLGVSVHFPTFFSITDEWDTRMTTKYDDGRVYSYSPQNTDYSLAPATQSLNISSPFRFILSNAIVLEKIGLVSVDYELVDYKKMIFGNGASEVGDDFNKFDNLDLNEEVKEYMRLSHNVRIGAEKRIGPAYFRSGYSFAMSPFKKGVRNDNAHIHTGALGIGYRDSKFFTDLAIVHSITQYSSNLFPDFYADLFTSSINRTRVVATIGFRFQ